MSQYVAQIKSFVFLLSVQIKEATKWIKELKILSVDMMNSMRTV